MKYDRLIVDGYNIIGAWPEFRTLREQDFELARERLIHAMAEYQAVTGLSVTIVFDAYLQPGRESRMQKAGLISSTHGRTRRQMNGLKRQLLIGYKISGSS